MVTTILKNYKTSNDYARLKQMLDNGEMVIVLWSHYETWNLYSGIACKYDDTYHIDVYLWDKNSNMSFEQRCRSIGLNGISFVEPNI